MLLLLLLLLLSLLLLLLLYYGGTPSNEDKMFPSFNPFESEATQALVGIRASARTMAMVSSAA